MCKINDNHWFAGKNSLNISYFNCYVQIIINSNEEKIYYEMEIKNNQDDSIFLEFYSLEDAISFTEKVVKNANSNKEVLEKYKEKLNKKELYLPEEEYEYITLNSNEVDEAIIEYRGLKKSEDVFVKKEIDIIDDRPHVTFYLSELITTTGRGKRRRICHIVYDEELEHALDYYIRNVDYDLVDYKFLGGVYHTNYEPYDSSEVRYDGIQIKAKKKEHKNYKEYTVNKNTNK